MDEDLESQRMISRTPRTLLDSLPHGLESFITREETVKIVADRRAHGLFDFSSR